ncbi:GNAT family N-acetyltransferase [Nocardia blacklockiae]|uniref:GNAT family N-acetyltransferase n=1 Tax=Nocardia blacklockiae TaxID=480036 RepID=UPI002B4AB143|nr:GNAT family N-acetyltransferase [Nocardia blacklockiae]
MSPLRVGEELVTERLSLRRPVSADVDAVLAICGDPQPWVSTVADRAEAQRLYEQWDEQWQRLGYGYRVVRYRGEAAQLGFCGLRTARFKGQPGLNLFYRFASDTWGRGVATESAAAVVRWAEKWLPTLPVVARIRPENAASIKVARRVGLVRAEHFDEVDDEGLDWIHYASE